MPRKLARKVYFKISRSTGVRKLKPGGTKRVRTRAARQDHLTLSAPSGRDALMFGGAIGLAGGGVGLATGNIWGKEKRSPIKRPRR